MESTNLILETVCDKKIHVLSQYMKNDITKQTVNFDKYASTLKPTRFKEGNSDKPKSWKTKSIKEANLHSNQETRSKNTWKQHPVKKSSVNNKILNEKNLKRSFKWNILKVE